MSLPEPKAPSPLTVIASAVALVDMICDSGVLRPAHLAKLGPILQQPRTAGQLAEELVRMGALTTYQAERLLRDRAADLVLGPYVILDQVWSGLHLLPHAHGSPSTFLSESGEPMNNPALLLRSQRGQGNIDGSTN